MSAHSDINRNIDAQTGGHILIKPFDEPGDGSVAAGAADAAALGHGIGAGAVDDQPRARRSRPIDDAETEGHVRVRI